MSETNLPPQVLVDIFTSNDSRADSFLQTLPLKARCELLRNIAEGVFQRRRESLAHNLKAKQVLELIALIISKTYAARGDAFQLADDEALVRIADLLIEYDPQIVQRYSHMRITEEQLLRDFCWRQWSIE